MANGDTFGYLIDDEDILTGYRINHHPRRPSQVEDDEHDPELSDYVRFRLFLARQLALLKYAELHGDKRT